MIEFKNVNKQYENVNKKALNNINLTIEDGELVTILGTSGCGKTTLIKTINRLHEPDSGTILINGKDISKEDPIELRRHIGYVIQQIGLFPHMTIYENIATVPNILKWDKEKIKTRVNELLEMIELNPSEYSERYPKQLSGGQQQRVGLVRALAADPDIMLLDEPFGAIDAITRSKLQDELIKIHQSTNNKTFLFVTHDIHEAFKLGTKVIIMDQGEIKQYDTPENIINHPANEFVSELLKSGGY